MIAVEDVDGNLAAALHALTNLRGQRLLDVGTGTGRLPLLLAGQAAQVIGVDLHGDMLREQAVQRHLALGKWPLVQADARALPSANAWANVVTAGWALGHMRAWYAGDWQAQIGQALEEMSRVAAPGGWLVVMETLSTGSLVPAPPTPELAEYYVWLEHERGFSRQEISTDYQFVSVDEAVTLTEFFFGPDLAAKIRRNGWARLPEWTGLWSRQV